MSKKPSLAPRIAFALLVLVTLACGASSEATATLQPEEADVSPATEAPEVAPDLTTARILLDELPAGFEEMDTKDILAEEKAENGEEDLPEVFFSFVNSEQFQLVLGMSFLLDGFGDRFGFSSDLADGKATLQDFAVSMGAENIRDVKLLSDMQHIGDKQSAFTMVGDVEGVPMRVDGAIFQRGIVGSLILSMSVEGEQASISLQELSQLFDQRIQESLSATE